MTAILNCIREFSSVRRLIIHGFFLHNVVMIICDMFIQLADHNPSHT